MVPVLQGKDGQIADREFVFILGKAKGTACPVLSLSEKEVSIDRCRFSVTKSQRAGTTTFVTVP